MQVQCGGTLMELSLVKASDPRPVVVAVAGGRPDAVDQAWRAGRVVRNYYKYVTSPHPRRCAPESYTAAKILSKAEQNSDRRDFKTNATY
ncbi:hypothetical protein EVAR_676_1 [Eumeta japonica]|uniref:Uncharacterized protein n=1 Tax=Eumeta variegata TaxID=151549 RepID=A0A4C1SBL2_EUMVA|nr:hypothetical protein EVAR_676_1 [Eumeta japonica]